MSDALFIAATGMHAQQTQVDTIANNLANLNTVGFKKSRVSFEPLMPQVVPALHGAEAAGALAYQGMGAAVGAVMPDFVAGEMKPTQRDLDVAINGQGFLEVELPDGTHAYTRHGALSVNKDGFLVAANGLPLSAMITLPSDGQSLVINADGRVQMKSQTSDELVDVGVIELSRFVNDRGLKPMGEGLYVATEESGDPTYERAGENGAGTLAQGHLEASNVQMVEELTNLMVAQRAYEANSKVLQAADELASLVNNLRR
jgi:flagellar basal-body rod protein FlgG